MMQRIPLARPMFDSRETDAVKRVLDSGMLSGGDETHQFEREMANWLNAKHFITVTNGTTALEAVLAALPPMDGKDEILVPAFTFDATISAVYNAGYVPVFVDIEHGSYNIDLVQALRKKTARTRAMIVVHLYGQMVNMDMASALGVDIIEDAAQAVGATDFENRAPGTRSLAATFSFYATKNMTTGGEGGGIATNNDALALQLELLREHGAITKYYHVGLGHNWRMTEMQAAIGRVQLTKLPQFQRTRYANAMYYQSRFGNEAEIILPDIDTRHGVHQYVIQTGNKTRERIMIALQEKSIGFDVHYPKPAPSQPYIGHRDFTYPVSDMASRGNLSLPIGPWCEYDDLSEVADTVIGAL